MMTSSHTSNKHYSSLWITLIFLFIVCTLDGSLLVLSTHSIIKKLSLNYQCRINKKSVWLSHTWQWNGYTDHIFKPLLTAAEGILQILHGASHDKAKEKKLLVSIWATG